jgi:hypothetical protein
LSGAATVADQLAVADQLSEWLQLMLAEIARKQEEQRRAAEEEAARAPRQPPPAD